MNEQQLPPLPEPEAYWLGAAPAPEAKPEAQQPEAERLLREAVPHAEWREKRIYGLGPEVYQSWILEVPLLIPAESGMGAGKALDRALGIGASGED
jgi:hypothetical protein